MEWRTMRLLAMAPQHEPCQDSWLAWKKSMVPMYTKGLLLMIVVISVQVGVVGNDAFGMEGVKDSTCPLGW